MHGLGGRYKMLRETTKLRQTVHRVSAVFETQSENRKPSLHMCVWA